jgi:hypothetical protein
MTLPVWLKDLFGAEVAPGSVQLKRIVARETISPGVDEVTLECGHHARLSHQQLTEIPCRQCAEPAKK